MSYESQPSYLREILLSSNKETTFGAALGDGAMLYRPRFDGGIFARHGKEYYSDVNLSGKQHPWPTVRKLISEETGLSGALDLDNFLAGWLAAFCLHKVATAGGGPYTHTFTFEQATRIAPVTTVYTEDLAGIQRKWADMVISSLTISGAEKGPLQAQFEMLGSGKFFADPVTLPALATPVYLIGNDTDILIGAPSSAASIKERVRSWSFTFTNGVTHHRAPGGGLYSSFAKIGLQRVSVQLVVAAKDTEDIETLFLNDTLQELQVNTNSGANAQLKIKIPNLRFIAEPSLDGLEKVWTLTAGEQDVTKGSALELAEVVVINDQATYLVAA